MQNRTFYLLIVVVLIGMVCSFAQAENENQDIEVDQTQLFDFDANRLDGLHFVPLQGQFVLMGQIGSSISDNTSNGNSYSNSNISNASITLSYGLSDLLRFEIVQTMDQNTTTTNNTATNAGGFADPVYKLGYRLFGGVTGDRFLTIFVSVSPGQGASVKGSTLQNGNDLRGGDFNSVNLIGNFVNGPDEYSINGEYDFYGQQSNQYQTTTNNNYSDAYNTSELILNYRHHWSPRHFYNLQVTGTNSFTVNTYYQNGSGSWMVNHPIKLVPVLSYGFFVSNDFVTYLSYRYSPTNAYSTQNGLTTLGQENDIYLNANIAF